MHVCFVSIDFHTQHGGGGIASYVRVLGEALIARGHTITIIAKGELKHWEQVDGFNVLFWPLGSLHWYWYRLGLPVQMILPLRELEWSLGIWRAMREVRRRFVVDVIEGCETGNLFLSYMDVPLVMRLHGEPYVFAKYSGQNLHLGFRISRLFELMSLRRAGGITSPSRFQADEINQLLGDAHDRIKVIPNPIAPWILKQGLQYNRTLDDENQQLTVLYTGRIEHRKGTKPFLLSVSRVAKIFPDVQYVIAGGRRTSIDDVTLKTILDENEIGEHVKLLGHIPWEELVRWYRRADIFVMPSFYETFGISCLEAMAFGLPVVASDASALPEVVDDGVTGFLVPSGDSEALGNAVIRLLRKPNLRRRMGKSGQSRVLSKFTVERIVEQTVEVYEEVVGD